jgi:hypothetical protein
MKIEIKKKQLEVLICVNEDELSLLLCGLGATSPKSRENSGMSKDQAAFVGDFYFMLSDAVHNSRSEGEA